MAQKGIALDCSACKGEKTMHSGSVSRFSGIVRFIGYLIVTPSVIGVIFSVILFISTSSATSEVMNVSQSQAGQAGAAIGGAIGFGFALFLGCASLAGGLVGWLLLLKKNVYKCDVCGFIFDRA